MIHWVHLFNSPLEWGHSAQLTTDRWLALTRVCTLQTKAVLARLFPKSFLAWTLWSQVKMRQTISNRALFCRHMVWVNLSEPHSSTYIHLFDPSTYQIKQLFKVCCLEKTIFRIYKSIRKFHSIGMSQPGLRFFLEALAGDFQISELCYCQLTCIIGMEKKSKHQTACHNVSLWYSCSTSFSKQR